MLIKAWPNSNLLHPVSRIPTIQLRLEAGIHRLVTLVTGSAVGDDIIKEVH